MSLLDRFNARDEKPDLDALADALGGVVAAPAPIHTAAIGVLDKLLSLANAVSDPADETPLQMRVGLQMLTKFGPMLEEMLAKVEPEVIQRFMAALRDDIDEVIDAGPVAELKRGWINATPNLTAVPSDQQTEEAGGDQQHESGTASAD